MQWVVDANILIAGFLRSATTRELLLDERLSLWSPEHGVTEVERVLASPRLRRRLGGLTKQDVEALLAHLTSRMHLVSAAAYQHLMPAALRYAPHSEDAPYLALALHLDAPLWSNDEELAAQAAVSVHTTTSVLQLLKSS